MRSLRFTVGEWLGYPRHRDRYDDATLGLVREPETESAVIKSITADTLTVVNVAPFTIGGVDIDLRPPAPRNRTERRAGR